MVMRKFYQNKLWRSQLAAQREKDGAIVHFIELNDAEYSEELVVKIVEEADEILSSDSEEVLKEEVADIHEAIDCLLAVKNISMDEILAIKESKNIQFGSYTDRRIVEYVEYADGSSQAQDCLDNEEKYPELFEDDFQEGQDTSLAPKDECCSKKC